MTVSDFPVLADKAALGDSVSEKKQKDRKIRAYDMRVMCCTSYLSDVMIPKTIHSFVSRAH